MESVIIHICCRNVEAASKLLDAAFSSGFKRSGIIHEGSDVMVELTSPERVDTIVAKDGKIIITKDYLAVLVEEANKKLRQTREKLAKLTGKVETYL